MTLACCKSPPRPLTSLEKQRNAAFRNDCLKRLIFVLVILISAVFLIPALAADEDATLTLGSATWKKSDLRGGSKGFRWFVFNMAYYVYGALPQLIGDSGSLKLDPDAAYMTIFGNIYESMASIGMGLAVVWVMLDLIEKAQIDQMTPEVIIRWCIKMVVAIIVVDNADDMAKALMAVGNEFVDNLQYTGADNAANVELLNDCFERVKSGYFISLFTEFVELLIPAVAMIFCLLMMLVQIFGRILEAGVRFAFLPIGISDAFTHGINSPGMRYIKKFFAVCLQGAVLFAIMIAGSNMMGLVTARDGTFGFVENLGIITQLVIAVTMIGAMAKSQQIVNDIVGA